ncbi:hypothetical protein HDU93_005300, partial [Gonapodya sp. JEL0774]
DGVMDSGAVADQLKAIGWLISPHRNIAINEALLATQTTENGLRAAGGAVEWSGFSNASRENDYSFVDFGTPLQSFSLFHVGLLHVVEARVQSGIAGCPSTVNDSNINHLDGFNMGLVFRGFHDPRVGIHLRAAGIHITALKRFGVSWFHSARLAGLLSSILQEVVVTLTMEERREASTINQSADSSESAYYGAAGRRLGSWGDFISLSGLQGSLSADMRRVVNERSRAAGFQG